MREKRQFKRKSISIDVIFDMSPDQRGFESKTKDISVGGICLISRKPLSVDNVMNFKFTIPDTEKKIEVSGEVVWTEKPEDEKDDRYYSGIEFVQIDETDKDLISKYVDGATFIGT
jgi:uncharacterized protein (TIGR02266 family)